MSSIEKTNDLYHIALLYFKLNVYYINVSNLDWNYNNIPSLIDFQIMSSVFKKLKTEQKLLIKNLTGNNMNLICKDQFPGLNKDVCNIIQDFILDYNILFRIFHKIWILDYRKKINNLIEENKFDRMWYDFEDNDYHYAVVSLDDLYRFQRQLNN